MGGKCINCALNLTFLCCSLPLTESATVQLLLPRCVITFSTSRDTGHQAVHDLSLLSANQKC